MGWLLAHSRTATEIARAASETDALREERDRQRRALERTVNSYNRFAGYLESRVLVTARRFPGIDPSTLTAPSFIAEGTRRLTAEDLTADAVRGGPDRGPDGVAPRETPNPDTDVMISAELEIQARIAPGTLGDGSATRSGEPEGITPRRERS